ncbi:MAG: S9 family peptidase, partial [Bacteroidota bacterium]|nr:S9 family peptidase [Bacteroidota bacterium]
GQKHAFTISDLYKLKGVAEPQLSPDGKKIAFVVTENFLEQGKSNQDVYVMNSDGSDIKNLTNHPSVDNHPRWLSDGKSIMFVSTRENGPQAWRISVDGGEPEQLTDFSMGISDPQISPDEKIIFFSSNVFPDCGADNDCNKYNDSTISNGPIQAHLADRLLYRHWTSWKDGKRTHMLAYNLETKKYIDLSPGDFDSPAFEQSFCVSPNGEICYVSNHDLNEAESTNKDLFIVSPSGVEAKNITADNKAFDGDPQYSPDGKWIAYKFQTIPTYESDRFRIGLYDRKTGEKSVLTEEFDNWVNNFKWSPDSKSIYFTAQVEGHVPLYKVEIKSKKITKIIDVKTIDAFDLSSDGKTLVFSRRSVGEPVDLWSCSSNGKNLKRITFFNKQIADEVDIRPAEEMWIPSPTGKKIHTFIVKPHNFDPNKKYPLILNVHGGPQMQWADAFRGDWQVYPGSGYIVAFPNPHGSTGYGQKFTEAISKDWAGKVYQDIMAVADSLENISYVDKDCMGAMGWSYGGYFMMWLEGHTTRFKAIACMMGVYNLKAMHGATEELWFPQWDLGGTPWESDLYEKLSPNKHVKNFKTPCLVITGEKDYRVPYTQSLEFFTDLQKMSVPSRLIVFPNDGHWPSSVKSMPLYYNAHLDWFHKYLGGEPAPYDMTKMVRNQAIK